MKAQLGPNSLTSATKALLLSAFLCLAPHWAAPDHGQCQQGSLCVSTRPLHRLFCCSDMPLLPWSLIEFLLVPLDSVCWVWLPPGRIPDYLFTPESGWGAPPLTSYCAQCLFLSSDLSAAQLPVYLSVSPTPVCFPRTGVLSFTAASLCWLCCLACSMPSKCLLNECMTSHPSSWMSLWFVGLFFTSPGSMQDLSSPTRDWTHVPCNGNTLLTSGSPGKSPAFDIILSLGEANSGQFKLELRKCCRSQYTFLSLPLPSRSDFAGGHTLGTDAGSSVCRTSAGSKQPFPSSLALSSLSTNCFSLFGCSEFW